MSERRSLAMRAVTIVATALLCTASGLSAQSAPAPGRGNPDVQLAGESIDAMIGAYMKEHGVAGMAVAIVQAPYVTRATGFGVGDRERRTLVSANTIFNIAQMKNAFTAVAIMQLVEAGRVALDQPIGTSTVRQSLRTAADYPQLERLVARASGQGYQE